MNLYFAIKLLIKNTKWLVFVPILLAVVVFLATRNQKRVFKSTATIYTGLASGYDIESNGTERFDNYAVNSAYDNFLNIAKSRNTLELVGIKLFAQHLIKQKEEKRPMNAKDWQEFEKVVPSALSQAVASTNTLREVVALLKDSVDHSKNEFYRKTLHTSGSFYSVKTLSSIGLKRQGSGDLVEIIYESHDQDVCRHTLSLFLETLLSRYKDLRLSETNSAVAYFQKELKRAFNELSVAEDQIKLFREQNRIINYQEQTRYIAEKQEDASDEFHKELMAQKAAESALEEIEVKLKISEKISEKNDEILLLKNELSVINTKLTLIEITEPNNEIINDLAARSKELKRQISKAVSSLYTLSHSVEGVPVSMLLNEWLDYMIEVDKAKARVGQFESKLLEMDRKYDKFAPLGSQLSKLERKVDVAERAYLQILHGLNQAKIKEQSETLRAKLTVVDPPSWPIFPMPSNRKVLLIATFIAGIIMVVTIIFLTEFLNKSIKSVESAEMLTRLPVVGAIPNLANKRIKKNTGFVNQSVKHLISSIKNNKGKNGKVLLMSNQSGEGKSKIIELVNAQALGSELVLIEAGSIAEQNLDINSFSENDLVIWVMKANTSWSKAHERFMQQLETNKPLNVQLLINGMEMFWFTSLLGQFSTSKNLLRRLFKRASNLEFTQPINWK